MTEASEQQWCFGRKGLQDVVKTNSCPADTKAFSLLWKLSFKTGRALWSIPHFHDPANACMVRASHGSWPTSCFQGDMQLGAHEKRPHLSFAACCNRASCIDAAPAPPAFALPPETSLLAGFPPSIRAPPSPAPVIMRAAHQRESESVRLVILSWWVPSCEWHKQIYLSDSRSTHSVEQCRLDHETTVNQP